MQSSTPQGTSQYTTDNPSRQERNYETSIQKQIEEEEQKYKAAMLADQTFEVVKAIRERINHLKKLLE